MRLFGRSFEECRARGMHESKDQELSLENLNPKFKTVATAAFWRCGVLKIYLKISGEYYVDDVLINPTEKNDILQTMEGVPDDWWVTFTWINPEKTRFATSFHPPDVDPMRLLEAKIYV